jgi:hypothetical protein
MAGFARVHKKRRGTGTGEGGSYFVSNVARFAHAGDHHAPTACQKKFACAVKTIIYCLAHSGDCVGF